ncbi:MAG: hypothetical protein N2109_00825 [Fimbriimonadales bacterium]|nr:hypothetical protein [Fimbriimonadales bacterium]
MDLAGLRNATVEVVTSAAAIASRERGRLSVERKPDGSLVTNADRAVEEFLRPRLQSLFPGAAVWGEELGRDAKDSRTWWLIDPVDGTTNFAHGSPLWGVSVALMVDSMLSIGVVALPDLDETYVAASGLGAMRNGAALPKLRPGPILPHEPVSVSEAVLQEYPAHRIPGKLRCTGAVVVDGAFVAAGRYRGMLGKREKLYDIAAILLINQELGAMLQTPEGSPVPLGRLLQGQPMGEVWGIWPPSPAPSSPPRS